MRTVFVFAFVGTEEKRSEQNFTLQKTKMFGIERSSMMFTLKTITKVCNS